MNAFLVSIALAIRSVALVTADRGLASDFDREVFNVVFEEALSFWFDIVPVVVLIVCTVVAVVVGL